ncbi:MAG: ATP-binding protein [Clostridiaceae bacterium]|nr:ATP-binding protein [Clostridiaceae bacterium]
MYINRQMEKQIKTAAKNFPVLLLTGARQVGKSTLLKYLAGEEREYVTLDDPQERLTAREQPQLFLELHKPPVLIDEIQYAPELFSYIKMEVDKRQEDNLYWLTGSQVFSLMKNVQESLAGRVMILRLQGISQSEEIGRKQDSFPPQLTLISELSKSEALLPLRNSLNQRMLRGSFPRLLTHPDLKAGDFYSSYLQTWLERDVAEITNIMDTGVFLQFVRLLAVRTGQELNKADLAKIIQVDAKTVTRWLNVLEASGLVHLLPAWSKNIGKRLIKRPKVYFLDSGLACNLIGIESEDQLVSSPLYGSLYETWIVSEILKSFWNNGKRPQIYYYRDVEQKEIDLLIYKGDKIYPFEIKSNISPTNAFRNFTVLKPLADKIDFGGVICHTDRLLPKDEKHWYIPDFII